MKKYLLYALLAVSTGTALVSCSEDDLNAESVITIDKKQANDFDKWLTANFVNPYNLEFKYRYEYKETDADYYTIPAELNQAIEMAHLVKYLCLESYDEVAGIDFTRNYFPKMTPFSFSSFSALALASSSWKFVRIVRSALKGVGSPR